MNSRPSPAEAPRPRFGIVFAVLLLVAPVVTSCSGPALTGVGGIEVSSMGTSQRSVASGWDSESLPVSGNANQLFQDLGPDYFGKLLRNLPDVEGVE